MCRPGWLTHTTDPIRWPYMSETCNEFAWKQITYLKQNSKTVFHIIVHKCIYMYVYVYIYVCVCVLLTDPIPGV
jgi:hypothetical protein